MEVITVTSAAGSADLGAGARGRQGRGGWVAGPRSLNFLDENRPRCEQNGAGICTPTM